MGDQRATPEESASCDRPRVSESHDPAPWILLSRCQLTPDPAGAPPVPARSGPNRKTPDRPCAIEHVRMLPVCDSHEHIIRSVGGRDGDRPPKRDHVRLRLAHRHFLWRQVEGQFRAGRYDAARNPHGGVGITGILHADRSRGSGTARQFSARRCEFRNAYGAIHPSDTPPVAVVGGRRQLHGAVVPSAPCPRGALLPHGA